MTVEVLIHCMNSSCFGCWASQPGRQFNVIAASNACHSHHPSFPKVVTELPRAHSSELFFIYTTCSIPILPTCPSHGMRSLCK